jgi:hypothetical protein
LLNPESGDESTDGNFEEILIQKAGKHHVIAMQSGKNVLDGINLFVWSFENNLIGMVGNNIVIFYDVEANDKGKK